MDSIGAKARKARILSRQANLFDRPSPCTKCEAQDSIRCVRQICSDSVVLEHANRQLAQRRNLRARRRATKRRSKIENTRVRNFCQTNGALQWRTYFVSYQILRRTLPVVPVVSRDAPPTGESARLGAISRETFPMKRAKRMNELVSQAPSPRPGGWKMHAWGHPLTVQRTSNPPRRGEGPERTRSPATRRARRSWHNASCGATNDIAPAPFCWQCQRSLQPIHALFQQSGQSRCEALPIICIVTVA